MAILSTWGGGGVNLINGEREMRGRKRKKDVVRGGNDGARPCHALSTACIHANGGIVQREKGRERENAWKRGNVNRDRERK